MRTTSISLAAAILFAAAPRAALAETPHYEVELHAPKHLPTCNDPKGFREALDLALAQPLLEPPASRVLVVHVDRKAGAPYTVELLIKDLEGHELAKVRREYPATMECFKVLHKSALVAAIAMDEPEEVRAEEIAPAERTATPTSPNVCPTPPPCPTCPTCPRCPSPPAAPRPPPVRPWFVGAGGMFIVGAAPEPLGGFQIAGGRRWPWWSLELNARMTLPVDTRPLGPTVVRIYTVGSMLGAVCLRPGPFGICGLFGGSLMVAVAVNRLYPARRETVSLGMGVRGYVEGSVSERLALRVRVDAELMGTTLHSQFENAPDFVRWNTGDLTATFGVWILRAF